MVLRVRALLVSAAFVASIGSVAAVSAQQLPVVTTPDAATSAALGAWHTAALTLVAPQYHDALSAMYADKAVDPSIVNEAAAAKAVAETAALSQMDSTSQALIHGYFDQQVAETFHDDAVTDN